MPNIGDAPDMRRYDRLTAAVPISSYPLRPYLDTARMLLGLPLQFGYVALALLIAGESAGVPLPGETALVAASALAATGHLDFPLVLLTAAVAAVVGDNFGYLVGRLGGYRLLAGRGPLQAHRSRLAARGDAFFADHGAMAVFLGRWTPFLRVTAAVLAGTHHMKWRHFLVWNTLGGVGWAVTIGGAPTSWAVDSPARSRESGSRRACSGRWASPDAWRTRGSGTPRGGQRVPAGSAKTVCVRARAGILARWRAPAFIAGIGTLAVIASVWLDVLEF